MTHPLHPSVLREYDIRGIVGRTLDAADAVAVGRAYATMLRRAGGWRVAVCRDGRLSSPMLKAALIEGLIAGGADVIDIGVGPSPMLYFAAASDEQVDGGVQVTGSHNPADHNGFKFVLHRRALFGADIRELGRIAAAGEWTQGAGRVAQREVLPGYVARLAAELARCDPAWLAELRVGWDAGNGAAGPAVAALTRLLPGEHHLLYCEIDGHFPHHHPDPTVETNLAALRDLVTAKNLHFGVAFDGDGDRIAVVDAKGRVLWGDRLLMILAEDLLREVPGAAVIADVKSSDALFARVAALGGRPVMGPTGHSVLRSKMAEIGAPLAGELSGHIFFGHRWYGCDDALLAAVRLIAATARLGRSVTALRDAMPELVGTPDIRFAAPDDVKFAIVARVAARLRGRGAVVDSTDGVRVSAPDGWWLLRASNTEPMLTARAESATQAGLTRLLGVIADELTGAGMVPPAAFGDFGILA